MATNEFLPFATVSGANVMSQSDWVSLPARSTGFQDGVAMPDECNKAWRQASFIGAVIGQFIADYSGLDALDNGNVADLEAKFVAALAAAADGANYLVDSGTANAVVVTSPSIGATVAAGNLLLIRIAANNTGPATLKVNSLAAVPILNPDDSPLIAGQLAAAAIAPVVYNGSAWELLSAPSIPRLIQSGAVTFAAAAGTANAITATLAPAPAAYAAGLSINIKVAATNTGAATINVNGLGAKTIVRADGAPLSAGDLLAGQVTELVYDGTNFQVSGLTAGSRALNGMAVFSSSGNWTVPAGVTRALVTVVGGGGGGASSSASQAGGGGAAGGAAIKLVTGLTPGGTVAVTVGTGGAGGIGSGGSGVAGGASSFGSFCSATGGSPASLVSATSSPGGTGGSGTGGDININGGYGTDALPNSIDLGGHGGGSIFGSGGRAGVGGGLAGPAWGSGGGGGYSSGSAAGGAGASGVVIIRW